MLAHRFLFPFQVDSGRAGIQLCELPAIALRSVTWRYFGGRVKLLTSLKCRMTGPAVPPPTALPRDDV